MRVRADHTNIFDSFIAQDIFVSDILERIAHDWKKKGRKEFNKENFEEFIFDEFTCWLESGLAEFYEAEFREVKE